MTTADPLSAVLWAAVSSKPQTERDSLDQQLADARALCEVRHWRIVAELVVPGQSRSYIEYVEAERHIDAYVALRRLCKERAFDVLICRARDRLGRTDALIAQVEGIVNAAGGQVYSMTMPAEPGPAGDRDTWLSAVERAGAQSEVTRLRRRTKAGKDGSTRQGYFAHGTVPFGYRRVRDLRPDDFTHTENLGNKTARDLVIYEPEAIAIRWMYDRYLNSGRGIISMVREAGALAMPSPGPSGWYYTAAHYILSNPLYAGFVGGDVPGRHTAIVTPALFEQVQALLAKRAAMHPRCAGSTRLFSGLLRCGRCGHAMITTTELSGSGKYSYPAYRCGGKRHGYTPRCTQPTVYEARLRREIVGWLATFADDAAAFDAWRAGAHTDGDLPARLMAAITDADKALTFWDRQGERGVISELEWERNRRRIIDERAGLERDLAVATDKARRAVALPGRDEWRELCEHPDDASLRAFLLRVVDRVVVDGKAIDVYLV